MEKVFAEEGIETEVIRLGTKAMQGCIACEKCRELNKCVFNDLVNEVAAKLETADGMIVGAGFVSARRSGCTASFDVLNKFFTNCGMPVVSSNYWNNIYGWEPGEGAKDEEGLQVARTLARNASFLVKAIDMAKKSIGMPNKEEPRVWTNFFGD